MLLSDLDLYGVPSVSKVRKVHAFLRKITCNFIFKVRALYNMCMHIGTFETNGTAYACFYEEQCEPTELLALKR